VTTDDDTFLAWFRSKVREAQDDPRPTTPHAHVMQDAQVLIDEKLRSRSQ